MKFLQTPLWTLALIFQTSAALWHTKTNGQTPYFDLTNALNNRNSTEIKLVLSLTNYVYYRTDKVVSEITKLSWVAEDLHFHAKNNADRNSSFCLLVSFSYTYNNSKISSFQYDDLLYSWPIDQVQNRNQTSLLEEHLCGIVLDIQVDWPNFMIDSVDASYNNKWEISFTKYAKKIIDRTFVTKTIPVGVAYSEAQIGRDWQLAEWEIPFADFFVVSVDLLPVFKMPLDRYEQLDSYLGHVISNNEHYLRNASELASRYILKQKHRAERETIIMISWKGRKDTLIIASELDGAKSLLYRKALEDVIKASERKYLAIYEEFVGVWLERHGFKGIISGHVYDYKKRNQTAVLNSMGSDGRIGFFITQLYVHETDTTACQLKSMMTKVSSMFETLVVNEYTLNAIIHGNAELEHKTCTLATKTDSNFPKGTILLGTEGISWRLPKITKLLNNSLVTKLNLKTIVFSEVDLHAELAKQDSVDKFILKDLRHFKMNVGCLVNLDNQNYTIDPTIIVKHVKTQCHLVLSKSKIMFWKISMNNFTSHLTPEEGLSQELAFEYFRSSWKRLFVNMLIARQIINDKRPDLEIVFHFVPDKEIDQVDKTFFCPASAENRFQFEFGRVLQKFAKLHDVRFTFKPAFDLNKPGYGWFLPPNEDGSSGLMDSNKC